MDLDYVSTIRKYMAIVRVFPKKNNETEKSSYVPRDVKMYVNFGKFLRICMTF